MPLSKAPYTRAQLRMLVHDAYVTGMRDWAEETGNEKNPRAELSWYELTTEDQEMDLRIGEMILDAIRRSPELRKVLRENDETQARMRGTRSSQQHPTPAQPSPSSRESHERKRPLRAISEERRKRMEP